jgi:hypothetical protein
MKKKLMSDKSIDNDAIKELLGIPMFYLSLASKELFHSNLIYWLSTIESGKILLKKIFKTDSLNYIDREISGAKIVVGQKPKQEGVKQEVKKKIPKADLVGYGDKDLKSIVIVIENKVKDIPNEQQINNIQESFHKKFPEKIIKYYILTFIAPSFDFENTILYKDFAKEIKLNINQFNGFTKAILENYITMVNAMQSVIDSYSLTGDYDFAKSLNDKIYKELRKVNLWENFQRVAGQDFCDRITKKLIQTNGYEDIKSSSSVNHQKATLNFYFEWKDFDIGIQIEDNQYRKFVYGKIDENAMNRLKAAGHWFTTEFDVARKKKIKSSTGELDDEEFPFGSYDMKDKGKFFYQYNTEFVQNFNLKQEIIFQKIKDSLGELLEKGKKEEIISVINNLKKDG